ncbi:MAG: alpha/beta fold hydrolase [Luteolibacter sp.]
MKTLLFTTLATLFSPLPLQAEAEKPRKIVLVHGFLNSSVHFGFMKKRFENRGFECYAPDLRPCDARCGLEKLALQLKQDIDTRYGRDQKIILIGYSMGGIVSRYYLQNLDGAKRCEKFITISSPHNGTVMARLYPSQGAREMRRHSEFLKQLATSESQLGKIPVVSYHTPMDLMILPATSSVWNRAENISYPILAHPLMLYSNRVIEDIAEKLEK